MVLSSFVDFFTGFLVGFLGFPLLWISCHFSFSFYLSFSFLSASPSVSLSPYTHTHFLCLPCPSFNGLSSCHKLLSIDTITTFSHFLFPWPFLSPILSRHCTWAMNVDKRSLLLEPYLWLLLTFSNSILSLYFFVTASRSTVLFKVEIDGAGSMDACR